MEDSQDRVPRVLVKYFRRNTKPIHLYTVFNNFGTITYLSAKRQQAVVEFSTWAAVEDILKCNLLKVQRGRVYCESLRKYLHVEPNQFYVKLHSELDSIDSEDMFNQYVSELCIQAADINPGTSESVCRTLEEIMRPVYPQCRAIPFGSSLSNLGQRGSGLDIFLDCGNMYNGEYGQMPMDQRILAETVLNQLLKCEQFGRIHSILHTKVPILKFFHVPTGTNGDIAFRNGLGVESFKLISFLQTLDSRLRPFFLLVKRWAKLQRISVISENNRFTDYALLLMAVFYLQQLPQPILPPIRDLMELYCGYQRTIAGWPCSFTLNVDAVPKTDNNASILELAKGFFEFCQFYEYSWLLICPYLGKPVSRSDMDRIVYPGGEEEELAYEFQIYVDNVRNDVSDILSTHTSICVQDPFDHSCNVARNIRNEALMNFISSCGLMCEKIKELL